MNLIIKCSEIRGLDNNLSSVFSKPSSLDGSNPEIWKIISELQGNKAQILYATSELQNLSRNIIEQFQTLDLNKFTNKISQMSKVLPDILRKIFHESHTGLENILAMKEIIGNEAMKTSTMSTDLVFLKDLNKGFEIKFKELNDKISGLENSFTKFQQEFNSLQLICSKTDTHVALIQELIKSPLNIQNNENKDNINLDILDKRIQSLTENLKTNIIENKKMIESINQSVDGLTIKINSTDKFKNLNKIFNPIEKKIDYLVQFAYEGQKVTNSDLSTQLANLINENQNIKDHLQTIQNMLLNLENNINDLNSLKKQYTDIMNQIALLNNIIKQLKEESKQYQQLNNDIKDIKQLLTEIKNQKNS